MDVGGTVNRSQSHSTAHCNVDPFMRDVPGSGWISAPYSIINPGLSKNED